MSHNDAKVETEDRSYVSALRIINGRQRLRRPRAAINNVAPTIRTPNTNGTPDLRGTPSIAGMPTWLRSLGHSEDDINRLNIIHVAGTKGKGSTCAFTESFLRAHGRRTGFPLRTGLYTSPHLILPEERIRIDSEPIGQRLFAKYFFEVYDCLPQLAEDYDPSKDVVERGPRYLQLFALLAFHVFVREKVDVTILETHNGGEYDATNIVQKPLVTAVTTLGMDHVDMLGPTIENIAWHKAGIFKSGATALSAPQEIAPAEVLQERGARKGEKVHFTEHDERLPRQHSVLEPDVQKTNASLAAAIAQAYLDRCAPERASLLTQEDLEVGIERFSWPGRFQIIEESDSTWYLDSAHNNMSVEVAAKWFVDAVTMSQKVGRPRLPRILIFSHINELRDAAALLDCLGKALEKNGACIDHVIFSTYDEAERELNSEIPHSPELFEQTWKAVNSSTTLWNEPTIQAAIARARKMGPSGVQTLITGSQHLVGPALRILQWPSNTARAD